MKTVETQVLRDHLDQEVTGLATCWEIERADGRIYLFTDSDEDLIIEGSTYSSIGAYKRTAIETSSTLSVDNLEVVGLANELALPAQDLRNGLFDNARVSVFMTAWSDAIPGKIKLRRGFFGEVQTLPNETFQVELRGLMQRLAYNYMDIFSVTCLYDLGEPSCGIVIRPDQVQRSRAYALGDVVLAAQSDEELGLRYDFTIQDPSFSTLSAGSFATSLNWYDSGANPMTTAVGGAFSAPASLVGGAGDGTTSQFIDFEGASDLPLSVVTNGDATFRLEGYRKNDGGDGRVRVTFLDEDGNTCTRGSAARTTVRQRYASTFNIPGDFTVMFWINPDDTSYGGIMAGGVGENSVLTLNTGSQIVYSDRAILLQSNYVTDNDLDTVISSPNLASDLTRVNTGVWNHVIVQREGTTVRIYINFELMSSDTTAWNGPFYFEDLFANNDEVIPFGTGLTPFDNGYLDDVRIYDEAIPYEEIVLITKGDPVTPDANLLRWFSFDDGTINDQTGNDATNYGTGAGTTTFVTSKAPFNGTGVATGYNSGFTDVGTTWVPFDTGPIEVPTQARVLRIDLDSQGVAGAWFDELRAKMLDTAQVDPAFLPSTLNNVYWECTSAGTTAATYPATYLGGAGSTAADGGATFTARNAYLRSGVVTNGGGPRVFNASITEPRAVDGWFQGGTVIFVTGDNAGVAMEVKSWVQSTGEVSLFLSVPDNIDIGSEFLIYPGCDKSRISCAAIFRNIINFFGFPDIPGQDELFRYPDAK
jgi:hypothetical protein